MPELFASERLHSIFDDSRNPSRSTLDPLREPFRDLLRRGTSSRLAESYLLVNEQTPTGGDGVVIERKQMTVREFAAEYLAGAFTESLSLPWLSITRMLEESLRNRTPIRVELPPRHRKDSWVETYVRERLLRELEQMDALEPDALVYLYGADRHPRYEPLRPPAIREFTPEELPRGTATGRGLQFSFADRFEPDLKVTQDFVSDRYTLRMTEAGASVMMSVSSEEFAQLREECEAKMLQQLYLDPFRRIRRMSAGPEPIPRDGITVLVQDGPPPLRDRRHGGTNPCAEIPL